MSDSPATVTALLQAPDDSSRESAWAAFLEEHTRVILSVATDIASDRDEAMDHYAFVADRLRQDDFRRLRRYAENGSAAFETWLVVIVRRLCVDHHRQRVGRPQSGSVGDARRQVEWAARRNLADLIARDVDSVPVPDESKDSLDDAVWKAQRSAAVESALASLTTKDQLLLTLKFKDDYSMEEIAGALGLSTRFHVHRRLKRLLAQLRTTLAQQGIHGL